MIIKSKVIFTDEYQTELLGKDVTHEEEILFDLKDVSGLMPANPTGTRTIIFLGGRDLTIKKPYGELSDLWKIEKKTNERIN